MGLELNVKLRGQRFGKVDRLLKRSQYVFLVDFGKKVQNQHFIVFFANGDTERCRLGITVSKRVGKAVTRNRIKRLAREYFRRNRTLFTRAWDIHLIAKRRVANCSAQNTMAALEQIFKRIESIHHG